MQKPNGYHTMLSKSEHIYKTRMWGDCKLQAISGSKVGLNAIKMAGIFSTGIIKLLGIFKLRPTLAHALH